MCRKAEPMTAIEMKRRLAIRRGREGGARRRGAFQLGAQLDVVVDLGIGDEGAAARLVERLVAGLQIDDGEPRLHDPDIARVVMAVAVGAAMTQRRAHRLQHAHRRRIALQRHDPGDAAHQRATAAKKS